VTAAWQCQVVFGEQAADCVVNPSPIGCALDAGEFVCLRQLPHRYFQLCPSSNRDSGNAVWNPSDTPNDL